MLVYFTQALSGYLWLTGCMLRGLRVLVMVEHDAVRGLVEKILRSRGVDVLTAADVDSGLLVAREYQPHAVFYSSAAPDRLTENGFSAPLIWCSSGFSSFSVRAEATLRKPFRVGELLETVQAVCGVA